MSPLVLALDQGTTSSRAILFAADLSIRGIGQHEITQHFPASGHVEHDAEEIWRTTLQAARDAIAKAGASPGDIAAIGIANQRETTVVWDRRTGRPIHRAIVWQDRRTAEACRSLAAQGADKLVGERTGLVLDPYFSATKIAWLLESIEGARAAAQAGRLAFGTIDCWLLWNLTGGERHATDATNAARTMLLDIRTAQWDEELLRLFRIPRAMLPEVTDCGADLGVTDPGLMGAAIPILGMAGDQQAATLGQACFEPGMMKATYGTGCFALINTGDEPVRSEARLLTTIAYQLEGQRTYALEGAIFIAGAAVQWLRDSLKIIDRAAAAGELAARAGTGQEIILVPAFTGLGAPYWEPEARGALLGLTRATGPAEIARATLESVALQTRDLVEAARRDWPEAARRRLRVDGGMASSDWTMQFLADILAAEVDRPTIQETTALGAAWLAGSRAGVWPGMEGFKALWRLDRRFSPGMAESEREQRFQRWRQAVAAVLGYTRAGCGQSPC